MVCIFDVQVISIVSGFRLKWPSEVLDLMAALSFSNFSMDIAKPECSVPTFKWFERWWCSMALPFVTIVLIAIGTYAQEPLRRFLTRMCANVLRSLLVNCVPIYGVVTDRARNN